MLEDAPLEAPEFPCAGLSAGYERWRVRWGQERLCEGCGEPVATRYDPGRVARVYDMAGAQGPHECKAAYSRQREYVKGHCGCGALVLQRLANQHLVEPDTLVGHVCAVSEPDLAPAAKAFWKAVRPAPQQSPPSIAVPRLSE